MKSTIVLISMVMILACVTARAVSADDLWAPDPLGSEDAAFGNVQVQTAPFFDVFVGKVGNGHDTIHGFDFGEPVAPVVGGGAPFNGKWSGDRQEMGSASCYQTGPSSDSWNAPVKAAAGSAQICNGSVVEKPQFKGRSESLSPAAPSDVLAEFGAEMTAFPEPVDVGDSKGRLNGPAAWTEFWADGNGSGMIGAPETPDGDIVAGGNPPVGLENTWRLVELNGEVVHAGQGQELPYMQLDLDENRVAGFAGCNQFFGGFGLEDSDLAFGPMGMTRMACPPAYGGDLEVAFVTALESTTNYIIQGTILELYSGEELVARFEYAPLPM